MSIQQQYHQTLRRCNVLAVLTDEQERQTNLALFKNWVGNWNLKRWTEVSKDDLNGVKVKY